MPTQPVEVVQQKLLDSSKVLSHSQQPRDLRFYISCGDSSILT